MNYEEVLSYINDLPPFVPVKRADGGLIFDLVTVTELARRAGNPQDKLSCVHIAGTNGKGSTAEFLSEILIKSGYKTGTFTSPYLSDIREQTKINGRVISEDDFANVFGEVIELSEEMKAEGLSAPSEFEMDVAASFLYFDREKCDICIIEAGLGGEFDATNIIQDPVLCLFTPISRDHTSVLGEALSDIARVKSGIIKTGCEVISARQEPEVVRILKEKAQEMSASFSVCDSPADVKARLQGVSFSKIIDGSSESFCTTVSGTYQAQNASLAIEAALRLKNKGFGDISVQNIKTGLLAVKRPGRFEIISSDPLMIADGAHNPGGVGALLISLKELFPDRFEKGKGFIFVAGVLADKEFDQMIEAVAPLAYMVYTVTPDNPRAMSAAKLAEIFRKMGANAEASDDVDGALMAACEDAVATGCPVVIFGSLYFLKELKMCQKGTVPLCQD